MSISKGQILEGTVTGITKFGAFVELSTMVRFVFTFVLVFFAIDSPPTHFSTDILYNKIHLKSISSCGCGLCDAE